MPLFNVPEDRDGTAKGNLIYVLSIWEGLVVAVAKLAAITALNAYRFVVARLKRLV
jgi:hypothetical protein